MIGKVYGSLVVTKYDAETETATVRCECGNTEYRKRRVLEQGRARICRDCKPNFCPNRATNHHRQRRS
jgi:predicted SprT family Zn-dependent metalloprotease